jgi:hypothetical protein
MPSNPQTTLIAIYLVYAGTSLFLTVWLARTLFKHGEVFLEEVFADNPRMAGAANHLLVVGFYLHRGVVRARLQSRQLLHRPMTE